MAIGQKWLANRFNKPGFDIFDYNIYTICGDGCLMEGIGSEAASLAGHLELDNLCWIYDNNHITIEGNTRITFTEDVAVRFLAYGWNVLRVGDANDLERIEHALATFRDTKGRPTFIVLDTHIGYGSPHKQDTSAAHGEPLGEEEVRLCQARLWMAGRRAVPGSGRCVRTFCGRNWRDAAPRPIKNGTISSPSTKRSIPTSRPRLTRCSAASCPQVGTAICLCFAADPKGMAGRDASNKVLNVLAQNIPWFLGGSGDLAPSNKTSLTFPGAGDLQPETPGGKNVHFGIREHAMCAIVNGLSLSKIRAFGATFFIFSDYARGAIRLSALMEMPVHLHFHPRRHGRWRGRTDTSANRTAGVVARHAVDGLVTSGRRQRGG